MPAPAAVFHSSLRNCSMPPLWRLYHSTRPRDRGTTPYMVPTSLHWSAWSPMQSATLMRNPAPPAEIACDWSGPKVIAGRPGTSSIPFG